MEGKAGHEVSSLPAEIWLAVQSHQFFPTAQRQFIAGNHRGFTGDWDSRAKTGTATQNGRKDLPPPSEKGSHQCQGSNVRPQVAFFDVHVSCVSSSRVDQDTCRDGNLVALVVRKDCELLPQMRGIARWQCAPGPPSGVESRVGSSCVSDRSPIWKPKNGEKTHRIGFKLWTGRAWPLGSEKHGHCHANLAIVGKWMEMVVVGKKIDT